MQYGNGRRIVEQGAAETALALTFLNISGELTQAPIRRAVTGMAWSRVRGTVLGRVVLVPGALLIVWLARIL